NTVAGHVFAVARQHEFTIAAAPEIERGLRNVLLRHSHFSAAFHVCQTPVAHHLLDRFLDVRLVPAQEALAIDRTLAAIIGPAIDQVGHCMRPVVVLAPVTMTCAPADTTRRAGVPAFPYSPCAPCARRNSGASACRRRMPLH